MDVWDRKTFKKIVTMQASNSSSCDWCPDGKHFMTSTLYRRLKVDNGVKIYHYTGVQVHQIEVKEMYQTSWQPLASDLFPDRVSLSPPPAGVKPVTPAAAVGKYRPPGARGESSKIIFVAMA
jgi:translation initiation factor 2A